MSEVVKSNISDQLFDAWWKSEDGLRALFSTLPTPEAIAKRTWNAAVKAFGWKSSAEHGLPEEVGNYMVVLENNHIIHAQLLHHNPYDPQSPKIWTAAAYGELEQEETMDYSASARYYFKQRDSGTAEALTDSQVQTTLKEEVDLMFSLYFVEGPLAGCFTPMVNPPRKRLPEYPQLATKIINDFGMGMTKIAYYRPLEMPQYESTDSDNTPQS
jgi:hypothetical protein